MEDVLNVKKLKLGLLNLVDDEKSLVNSDSKLNTNTTIRISVEGISVEAVYQTKTCMIAAVSLPFGIVNSPHAGTRAPAHVVMATAKPVGPGNIKGIIGRGSTTTTEELKFTPDASAELNDMLLGKGLNSLSGKGGLVKKQYEHTLPKVDHWQNFQLKSNQNQNSSSNQNQNSSTDQNQNSSAVTELLSVEQQQSDIRKLREALLTKGAVLYAKGKGKEKSALMTMGAQVMKEKGQRMKASKEGLAAAAQSSSSYYAGGGKSNIFGQSDEGSRLLRGVFTKLGLGNTQSKSSDSRVPSEAEPSKSIGAAASSDIVSLTPAYTAGHYPLSIDSSWGKDYIKAVIPEEDIILDGWIQEVVREKPKPISPLKEKEVTVVSSVPKIVNSKFTKAGPGSSTAAINISKAGVMSKAGAMKSVKSPINDNVTSISMSKAAGAI